jgi:hypothetical protein
LAHGHDPAKVKKIQYEHDGSLKIGILVPNLAHGENFGFVSIIFCPKTHKKQKNVPSAFMGP